MVSEAADQQWIEEMRAAEQRRQAIESAASRVSDRRDAAAAYDRGTHMAAGVLAAAVKADAGRSQVTLVELSYQTGLSRPTLDKYAEEWATAAKADDREYPEDLTNEELAARHLEYGPDNRSDIDREFWGRYPHLGGWYRSAWWLRTTHDDAWWDERGGFDPWETTDAPPNLPAYDQMMEKYREMVQAIAAGLELDTPQDA